MDAEPTVVVVSDDPEWCRTTLDFPTRVRVISEELSGAEQLHLLALCQHHVLSNSSFSFWGAWLAETPAQRVIAPRRWFTDGRGFAFPPAHWTLT